MATSQTVRLITDFNADLVAMARHYLTAQGATEDIAETDVLLKYFDSLRRWPAPRPRKVRKADNFFCPARIEAGWKLLRSKIEKGEDIRPHLGRDHAELSHLDGLLNEWGVHHLHLGVKPYFKDPNVIDRTTELVFALITDEEFLAINVFPDHGQWEALDILESLHRNWPELIRRYRINGVPAETVTSQGRRQLRSSNTQLFTMVNDGTVYGPIRGGVACSGVSIAAVMRAAQARRDMKRLQAAVQEQLDKFIIHLRPHGYSDGDDIKATLVGVGPHGYQVLFARYGVHANVLLDDESPGHSAAR
jgi:hypothetical protein